MSNEHLANPAPLGLMGFGMTTVLLSIHNAGFFPMNSMILAMGIFYGGMAQVLAGFLEYQKGNTFGFVAFVSYGYFWLSFVFINISPKLGFINMPSNTAIICYLFMWGIFTFVMFFGTLKSSKALQFVFASFTLLFFLLILAHLPIESAKAIRIIAGYEGIICGASAIYLAMAQVLYKVHGKVILPIG